MVLGARSDCQEGGMGGAMRNGSIPCMSVLSDAYHIELGMLASQKWEEVGGVWGVTGGGI